MLVDGLELDQLLRIDVIAEQPRHRRAHDAVGVGLQAVDLLAGLERGLRALLVAQAALKTCEEIDRLESDADRVMRSAMSRLFREEEDVRELIKLRAIYELLESISDRCEDVANLIEGVVLENS